MHLNCLWVSQAILTTMETEPRICTMTPLGRNLVLWILLIGYSLLCYPLSGMQSRWLCLFLLSTGAHNAPIGKSTIHASKSFWDMGVSKGEAMCVRKRRQIAPEGFRCCLRTCEVIRTFEKYGELRRKGGWPGSFTERCPRPQLLQTSVQSVCNHNDKPPKLRRSPLLTLMLKYL